MNEQHPSPPPAAAEPPPASSSLRQLVDNPWAVLATLFLVTAALGLPLLWVSRGFSPLMKWVWSLAVLVYTAAILWLFWQVMRWSYEQIAPAVFGM